MLDMREMQRRWMQSNTGLPPKWEHKARELATLLYEVHVKRGGMPGAFAFGAWFGDWTDDGAEARARPFVSAAAEDAFLYGCDGPVVRRLREIALGPDRELREILDQVKLSADEIVSLSVPDPTG